MQWIKTSDTTYKCPKCHAEISVEQGKELPGYCKQCETEFDEPIETMTDNEKTSAILTDAEIKQALERCLTANCDICPNLFVGGNGVVDCRRGMITNTLDLINRQQAEIERLKELLEGWKTEAYKVANEKDKLYCEAVKRLRTTKSEAIKEFAERLKTVYTSDKRYDRPNPHTLLIYLFANIDTLVKEMVGDAG